MIDLAVADAKRTHAGLPTDMAIFARFWIDEHRPPEQQREQWQWSFSCACHWLSLDVETERKRLLLTIDDALCAAYLDHARAYRYLRRPAVLSCAGIVVAVGGQFVLPMVDALDHEHITGFDDTADPLPTLPMPKPVRRRLPPRVRKPRFDEMRAIPA